MKTLVLATALTAIASSAAGAAGSFHVEEATIADMHAAIQSGETTCTEIIQQYIARAKVYNNGLCTALVTPEAVLRIERRPASLDRKDRDCALRCSDRRHDGIG